MNLIDKCSQADECATIGNCNISCQQKSREHPTWHATWCSPTFFRKIDWCIFILPSRESDGALCFGRIRTRLGFDHFPSFTVDVLTSSHVNLLLVRSHQAEIIILKRLIQGRNNVTRVRVELIILRTESS